MRRVAPFPLEAWIAFWWVESGIVIRGDGRTREISEAGAFVFTSTCPRTGTKIGFKIFLPGLPGSEHGTRLEGAGQALRIEQAPGRKAGSGFAILTQQMLLLGVNSDIYERGESGDQRPQFGRTFSD